VTNRWNAFPASFCLVLIAIGSAYWIWSYALAPQATLDQRILFRPDGDADYLPQVAALSRFHLGEAAVRELANTGVRSFPMAATLAHSALVRLFGDAGFVLADILAVLLYGYLLSRFLQAAGIASRVAGMLAAAVVAGAGELFVANASRFTGPIPVMFWASRFPRPSVTEILVLLVLLLWIRLFSRGPAAGLSDWALLGMVGGCLLQADIYQAVSLAIGSSLLVLVVLLRDAKSALRGASAAALAAAATALPFLYQRTHELADIPKRWGVFSLSGHHWYPFTPLRLFVIIPVVVAISFAYWWRSPLEYRAQVRTTAPVMGALLAVSAFAGPLSLLTFRTGIEIYHYSATAQMMAGYGILLCLGWIAQDFLRRAGILGSGRSMAAVAGFVFAACLVLGAWTAYHSFAEVWWGRRQSAVADPRDRGRFDRAEEVRYRSAFQQLHEVLARPEYRGAEVLGTFDGEVMNWWEYRGKYVYLPDIFNTTVADTEVEARVYAFMHLLEASDQDFSHALDNWYFQLRVLSFAKYQANMAFTPWPLEDYSPEAQKRIVHRGILEGKMPELPLPERTRLMEGYAHFDPLQQPPRRLDLIVLSRGTDLRQDVHPEKGNLRLLWQNEVFELWVPGTTAPRFPDSSAAELSTFRR
jgi:hypothetical protein